MQGYKSSTGESMLFTSNIDFFHAAFMCVVCKVVLRGALSCISTTLHSSHMSVVVCSLVLSNGHRMARPSDFIDYDYNKAAQISLQKLFMALMYATRKTHGSRLAHFIFSTPLQNHRKYLTKFRTHVCIQQKHVTDKST